MVRERDLCSMRSAVCGLRSALCACNSICHANPSPMQYPCQLDLGCAVPPLKRKHFYPGLRPKLMTTASPSGPRSLKAAPTHQPQPLNGPPEPPEARQYRPDPVS